MDEPGGHDARFNKPVTEGQRLHDTTCVRYITVASRIVVAKGLEGGVNRELLFNWHKISFMQDDYVLEICYTTVCL